MQARRLVLCCDGTWDSADGGGAASNVVRMLRSVKATAADGTMQIAYYHPGVGTGNGLDRLIGGATGVGLARNLRDAYAFIVNNYVPGDEIFLFGFSRGAYAARVISGLVDTIGLLRKNDMGRFLDAWAFYRLPDRDRQRRRADFERSFAGRTIGVPIRCIGVWDTVGALGIPANRFLGMPVCRAAYRFLSVKLCPGVEHAFQALAIDEKRVAFARAVWERDPQAPARQVIRQVWFAGVHADVGGGYAQHSAADLTFLWMAAQIRDLLDLDEANIEGELDKSQEYGHGELHESRSWFGALSGMCCIGRSGGASARPSIKA
ncbi:MAG: T6SS phospholipase effector Tle1-like catalytic domain-containing protein [Thiohalocapsa sp.]